MLSYWKGTEYRTFLLYASIVVLRKFLPKKYYEHFLLYFCSITICTVNFHLVDLLETAEEMLNVFLEFFVKIYGSEFIVSNIHNLCHLVNEVRRFGPLITFSAYPFESKLHSIKLDLRTGYLPLAQVGKRQIEREFSFKKTITSDSQRIYPVLNKQLKTDNSLHLSHSNVNHSYYEEIQFSDFLINTSEGNKYFLTSDLQVVMTKFIVYDKRSEQKFICGSPFEKLDDFFMKPFPSRVLHIYIADHKLLPSKMYPIECVKAKMFELKFIGEYDDNENDDDENEDVISRHVFVPLIHTLK